MRANLTCFCRPALLLAWLTCAILEPVQAQVTLRADPIVTTSRVRGDADDPAIWIHPTDSAQSRIIGTDKGSRGGLFVWNLAGEEVQRIELKRPNNVDVELNVNLAGASRDIAVVNLRATDELKVFDIDRTTGLLTDITGAAGIPLREVRDPYGLTLYRRASDGAIFVIISDKSARRGRDRLFQYQLSSDGSGGVSGTLARSFGSGIRGAAEGLVADDELGFLYASDERRSVRKYLADPDSGSSGEIASFALGDGIRGDREGLAIYRCSDGTGYILLSSQGNSTLKIYPREGDPGSPNSHSLIATLITTGSKITDGIDVTSATAGPGFPEGFVVKHNARGRNFALYRWDEIAGDVLKVCR